MLKQNPFNGDLRGRHERSIDVGEFNNTGLMPVPWAFENCYSESISGVETAPVQSGTPILQSPKQG